MPISQIALNKFGEEHPEFEVPNLYDHPFLNPYALLEENFKRIQDNVAEERAKVEQWTDHPYAAKNWHPNHPWPWSVHPDARPSPQSYCKGRGKPVTTKIGKKCLTCEKHHRECFDGETRDGKCTTCQGQKAIQAYQKSQGQKGDERGQSRVCYWPQQEFFINDHDSAKLFHKKARWCHKNTKKEVSKRRVRNEDAEKATGAAQRLSQTPSSSPSSGCTTWSENASIGTPPRSQRLSGKIDAVVHGLSLAPVAPLRAASRGEVGGGGIFDPVAHGYISAPDQNFQTGSESLMNSRGTKRGRTQDIEKLSLPAKRSRDERRLTPIPSFSNYSIELDQLPNNSVVSAPFAMPPKDGDLVRGQYDQLMYQFEQHKVAGNYMEAALIQAALNLAGNDLARVVQLTQSPADSRVKKERFMVLAAWSDWTHEEMTTTLNNIQTNHSIIQFVSDDDMALALSLQAALNISQGGIHSAPAAFLVRDANFQAELARLARPESDGGPFDTYRLLTEDEILVILGRAQGVQDQQSRSQIRHLLRQLGLNFDGIIGKEIAMNVPDYVARIIESIVAKAAHA